MVGGMTGGVAGRRLDQQIVVERILHGHQPIKPGCDHGMNGIGENLARKWESFTGEHPKNECIFHPDIAYIQRRRTSKAITIKPGEIVIGHMVPFEAEGDPEILRFAYETGFGSRNSMGFGMVNIAH